METTTLTQSNYSNDYNAFQLSLPLDLGIKIDPVDRDIAPKNRKIDIKFMTSCIT